MTESANKKPAPALSTSSAFRFVLTLGIVNLFADMTYEGASSINGPYLGALGAGAAAIGVISGCPASRASRAGDSGTETETLCSPKSYSVPAHRDEVSRMER